MEQVIECWLDSNKDWFRKYAIENIDINLVEKWLRTQNKKICKCVAAEASVGVGSTTTTTTAATRAVSPSNGGPVKNYQLTVSTSNNLCRSSNELNVSNSPTKMNSLNSLLVESTHNNDLEHMMNRKFSLNSRLDRMSGESDELTRQSVESSMKRKESSPHVNKKTSCSNCIIHKRKLFSNLYAENHASNNKFYQDGEPAFAHQQHSHTDTVFSHDESIQVPIIVGDDQVKIEQEENDENKPATEDTVATGTDNQSANSLNLLKCLIKSKIKFQSSVKHSNKLKLKKEISLSDTKLMLELIKDISNELHMRALVDKIVHNLKMLVSAEHCSLYFVCQNKQRLACFRTKNKSSSLAPVSSSTPSSVSGSGIGTDTDNPYDFDQEMSFGHSLLGKVAQSGNLLNSVDVVQDKRFNSSIDNPEHLDIKSMLCMPIKYGDNDTIAIVQMINKTQEVSSNTDTDSAINGFDMKDIRLLNSYLPFCAVAISNAQTIEEYQYEYERNRALLEVLHDLFEEQTNLDKIIFRIMVKAQTLLKCQRCSILIDTDVGRNSCSSSTSSSIELETAPPPIRKTFDLFLSGAKANKRRKSVEQDDGTKISRLLANHVLKTGEKLNLTNAYADARFDPLVDTVWSFKSENLLCLPIRDQTGGIIGCAQITNRMDDEPFDENDEQLFEAFCIFCGLAINNSIIFNQLEASMAEKSVALDVLSYHATVTKSELNNFMDKHVPNMPKKANHVPPSLPKSLLNGLMQREKLASYIFDDFSLNSDEMVIASYEMFQQSGLMKAFQIERNVLLQWLLTVRKNYRNVAYHNWSHAFNVSQSMFAIFENSAMAKYLQDIEKLALIVGCLCHDLDHRGENNKFQVDSHSALSLLYGTTATMEKHHFNHCIMILSSPGHNIFSHIKPRTYSLVISYMKEAILATDLQDHFNIRKSFEEATQNKNTVWTEEPYASLLRKNLMTSCDLAASTKPWEVHVKVVNLVTMEFFAQGDRERLELNKEPNEMMDARRSHELPRMQIGWIDSVILPLYLNLSNVCDTFKGHLTRARDNKRNWSILYDRSKLTAVLNDTNERNTIV